MSNFREKLTIGRELIYKAVGKTDGTDESDEYVEGNLQVKNIMSHYSKMVALNKKYQNIARELAPIEAEMAHEMMSYSEILKCSAPRTPRFSLDKNPDDVSLSLQTLGATLQYLSTARQKMNSDINDLFTICEDFQQDIGRVKDAKQLYHQYRVDYGVLEKRTVSLMKSGGEAAKTAERDMLEGKSDADAVHQLCLDNFAYVIKRRDYEYLNLIRSWINCFKRNALESTKTLFEVRTFTEVKDYPKIDFPKYLTKESLDQTRIVGVEFEEILQRSGENDVIPNAFRLLVNHLLKFGPNHEGIFRINGTENEIKNVCLLFNSRKITEASNLEDIHINVVAAVFKQILRKLPTPLLTFDQYPNFLALNITTISPEEKLKKLEDLLRGLPLTKRISIGILLNLLDVIAKNSSKNMMPASNLAVCIAPNILRNRDENPLLLLKEGKTINLVVEYIIVNYHNIKHVFEDLKPEKVQQVALAKDNSPILTKVGFESDEKSQKLYTRPFSDNMIEDYMTDPHVIQKTKMDIDDESLDITNQIKMTFTQTPEQLPEQSENFFTELTSIPITLSCCFTGIFATKESSFELYLGNTVIFSSTASIKHDDIVLIDESVPYDTKSINVRMTMPMKNIDIRKTLNLHDGCCFTFGVFGSHVYSQSKTFNPLK